MKETIETLELREKQIKKQMGCLGAEVFLDYRLQRQSPSGTDAQWKRLSDLLKETREKLERARARELWYDIHYEYLVVEQKERERDGPEIECDHVFHQEDDGWYCTRCGELEQ